MAGGLAALLPPHPHFYRPLRRSFLHPLHNFAIASYEVKDLPAAAVGKIRAASLLAEPLLQRGDVVRLVGLTKHLRIMQRRSTVTNATAALSIAAAEVPRFRCAVWRAWLALTCCWRCVCLCLWGRKPAAACCEAGSKLCALSHFMPLAHG